MKFAVAVMRRLDGTRTALFKQKQDLVFASLHGAAALSEIADCAKPKNLSVKLRNRD
jgi:hypothetical protein